MNNIFKLNLGDTGINHGIELYENVINYAKRNSQEILRRPETNAFAWKEPEFICGNVFLLDTPLRYDRIYCGALVPDVNRSFFCNLLKINGVIIMPYGRKVKFF